jgi:RNA polymerase sigma-70 factor, ECF subfamily
MALSDESIVAGIRNGDAAAFEGVFRAHYAALCAFALRYVGERALAEEIVQQLFSDLWTRADWRIHGSLRAYLFAAVRNRALNLRKRQRFERGWDEAADDALADDMPAADAQIEAAETSVRLSAALDRLPERCRLVMQLRWARRLSHAEIAEIMGISIKGVENQLSRGLKALRAYLE